MDANSKARSGAAQSNSTQQSRPSLPSHPPRLDLLVLRGRRDRSKDVEIVALRHQLAVLQREHARPTFEPDDRAILTALARVLGRDRGSIFMIKPETILRWHRRLVANTGPTHTGSADHP